MKRNSMQIKELIFDLKEPLVYCESFVWEPSNVEEEKLGHLFMIGRIRNVEESSFYLVNLLASRIKREYYSNYHRPPALAFEAALRGGNKVLKENEERTNWLGNLDFFVAQVDEKRIIFTLLGKMRAFILREGEVIDIVKNLIQEREVLFPFATILQAPIKKDDILIFSTSNIFFKEKLLEFGHELFPIKEEKISRFIASDESGIALVVEMEKGAGAVERILKEKERERIFQKLPKIPPLKLPRISLPKITTKLEKERIFNNIGKFFLSLEAKIKKGFVGLFESLKRKARKEEVPFPQIGPEKITLPERPKYIFFDFKRNLFKKRVIFAFSIFVLILFFIGFGLFRSQKAKEVALLEESISKARLKKTEGENALIYGDKKKALDNLAMSLNLLNSIDSAGPKETEIENLKIEIEEKISEILGRKILKSISPLFEIKGDFKPKEILFSKGNIYLIFTDSPLVYKWDILKKEGGFIEYREKILGGTILREEPFFLLAPTSVVITKEEKILPMDLPYEGVSIDEMDDFLDYFYIFDKKEGEIIRYGVKKSEITLPTLWFKEREAGKGAQSFAIDGNIYLGFADGKIKKFSVGKLREKISPPKTYPLLKGVTQIFTSKDNSYLYLMEPGEKRIIILDKKGNIISEYQSNQFENLIDIYVTPQDKTIYLLSGKEVFKIDL